MKQLEKTGYYEVKDRIFYHLFSYEKIEIGKIIEAGDQKNGMWKRVYQKDFCMNGKSSHDVVRIAQKRKLFKFIGAKELNQLQYVLNDYDFALRELALEDVRKEEFENYPSRFTCLFVVNTEEESLDWAPRLLWQRPNCQLIKLKCTGKIFVGDSKYNAKNNFCYEKSLELASGYWKGCLSKTPQLEILFEGKAEVVEVIKRLN